MRLSECLRSGLAAALLLLGSTLHAKAPADPQVPGELLLRLRSTAAAGPLFARYPVTLLGQFGARPLYRVRVVGSTDLAEVLGALKREPDVLVAEPNVMQRNPEARKNVVWAIGTADAYKAQWAPAAMRLAEAQTLSTGAGVRVAVLDTGIDATHPALAGRLLPGFDFVAGDTDPSEEGSPANTAYGHGTHVAGLVALVAPAARIVPLRVLDADGQGNTWVLAQALLHAADPDGNPATDDGAQVINLSLGTVERTRLLDTVLQLGTCSVPERPEPMNDFTDPGYAGDKERCRNFGGSVIVAAAGNGASASERQYPAAEGEYGLMSVAASAESRTLAAFSNSGNWIDIAAPGDRITSSVPGGYGTWSGTSMATSLATGAAALLRARFPAWQPVDVTRRMQDFSRPLCNTVLRQVDAAAALSGVMSAPVACP